MPVDEEEASLSRWGCRIFAVFLILGLLNDGWTLRDRIARLEAAGIAAITNTGTPEARRFLEIASEDDDEIEDY